MGVNYNYNDIYIDIPVDIMGASQIGIGGVTIGTAADYDRIKGLLPTNCRMKDDVNEECGINSIDENAAGLTFAIGNHAYVLKKKDGTLNCKATSF